MGDFCRRKNCQIQSPFGNECATQCSNNFIYNANNAHTAVDCTKIGLEIRNI